VTIPPGGGDGTAAFALCYSGDEAGAARALAPLRRLGGFEDDVRAVDYVEVQRSGDTDDPRAQAYYLNSGFVPELPGDMVSAIVEGIRSHPGRSTSVVFVQSGGAIARVAPDATAFPQRDAMANLLCSVRWRHGDDPAEHVDYIREFWPSLRRFTHGFYVNDVNPDLTGAAIQENYRRNHTRLLEVKNRYDPANLFRLNANIRPTAR
jgi:hypothetical protein